MGLMEFRVRRAARPPRRVSARLHVVAHARAVVCELARRTLRVHAERRRTTNYLRAQDVELVQVDGQGQALVRPPPAADVGGARGGAGSARGRRALAPPEGSGGGSSQGGGGATGGGGGSQGGNEEPLFGARLLRRVVGRRVPH